MSQEENAARIDAIISFHKSVGTDTDTERWPWGFLRSLRSQCTDRNRQLTRRQQEVLDEVSLKWSKEAFEKKASSEAMWKTQLDEVPEIKQQLRWVIDSLNASSLVDMFAYGKRNDWCFRKDVIEKGFWTSVRTRFDIDGEVKKRDFDRLMDNKFSKSLVKAMQSECKFNVGQLVAIRKEKLIDQKNKIDQYQTLSACWPLFQEHLEVINPTLVDINFLSIQKNITQSQDLFGMVIEHDPVPSLSNAAGCRPYRIMPVGDWQQAVPMLIVEERWLKKMPKKV